MATHLADDDAHIGLPDVLVEPCFNITREGLGRLAACLHVSNQRHRDTSIRAHGYLDAQILVAPDNHTQDV